MSARRPRPQVLEGRFVRLEPYRAEHLPGLWEALGHPEVFAGGYGGGPAGIPKDYDAFAEWFPRYVPHETGITFVVRLVGGQDAGRIVGASSIADFEEKYERAHIGWTGYDPRVWSTAVNAETKLLMLGLAFEHGYGRVKFQADARNARSRAAIAKLGATFEGIVRRDAPRADGTWRDAAVFSVIDEDWPRVRAGLEARLALWGASPVRLRS